MDADTNGAAAAPAGPPPHLALNRRSPPAPTGGRVPALAATTLEPQPSAWEEALEEASLQSPLAASAYGRSLFLRRSSLAAQLQLQAGAADEDVARGDHGGRAAVILEARK